MIWQPQCKKYRPLRFTTLIRSLLKLMRAFLWPSMGFEWCCQGRGKVPGVGALLRMEIAGDRCSPAEAACWGARALTHHWKCRPLVLSVPAVTTGVTGFKEGRKKLWSCSLTSSIQSKIKGGPRKSRGGCCARKLNAR